MDIPNKSIKNRILDFMDGCYKRIPEKLTTTLYLIGLSLFLLYDYNFLTRFPREPFQKVYIAGAALGCVVLVIRFLNIKNEDRIYVLVSILLLLCGLGYYLVRGSIYFLVLAIFMVGARHVSDRDIIRIYIVIAGVFFTVMVGQYFQVKGVPAGRTHSNFGGINTTDTQGMVFYIGIAYLFLRRKNIDFLELVVFGGISIWFWRHTYAENNLYCTMAGIATAALMIISKSIKLKRSKGLCLLTYIIALSFVICGFIMIILVAKYDSNNLVWVKLDKLLHNRMKIAHPVFIDHPPNVWGSDYVIVGLGYDPSQDVSNNLIKYGLTYIDSSYPQILIVHGYVIYIMIIGAMTAVTFRYAQRRDLYRVLLLAVIAVDCMAEGHLKEINCNIWQLCLFADIYDKNKLMNANTMYGSQPLRADDNIFKEDLTMKRFLTLLIALLLVLGMTGYTEQANVHNDETAKPEILQMNVWSKDVKALQKKLNELGFNCGYADGVMGEKTKGAIMQLQEAIGWEATGEVNMFDLQTILSLTKEDVQSGKVEISNMVLDGDFQNGDRYWTKWGNPTVCEIVEIDGKNWMHLVSSGKKFEGLHQAVLKRSGDISKPEIFAGKKYELSFKAFANEGSMTKEFACGVHINSLDADLAIKDQAWTRDLVMTSDVQTFTMVFKAAADGTFNVLIGNGYPGYRAGNEILDAYFTDVVLRPYNEENQ